jgi:serine/threonine-protein kinase
MDRPIEQSQKRPYDRSRRVIESSQSTVLGGRYEMMEHLGSGKSTVVYRAYDPLLERDVAIRLLKQAHAAPDLVERFRRWARVTASLSHPNIVQVYELGRSDSGRPFAAVEYVEGETLYQKLQSSGALDPNAAMEIAVEVARALRSAHGRGIAHCGLESRKVILNEAGRAKVTGFGAACDSLDGKDEARLNGDLHALGAMLYEMLTGTRPSSENDTSAGEPADAGNGPPRPPSESNPEIPEKISALTMSLMPGSREDRHRSSGAVLGELEDSLESPRSPRRADTSRTYGAGKRLLSLLLQSAGSLLSRPGKGSEGSKNGVRPETVLRQRLRRQRMRSLLLIPFTLLIAASAWTLYSGDLELAYPQASQQPQQPQAAPVQTDGGTSAESVLVHTADAESISSNSTYLDLPAVNGDRGARISITQNWNPEGGGSIYNDHPVGVWYDSDREQWAIFNQDRADMPEGASFNVVVWEAGGG